MEETLASKPNLNNDIELNVGKYSFGGFVLHEFEEYKVHYLYFRYE